MTQRDFERKERYGIRKFTVGAASVVIGAVVFGVSPVLAQEAPANTGETTGQALPELPKEVESGNLANRIYLGLLQDDTVARMVDKSGDSKSDTRGVSDLYGAGVRFSP